MVLPIRCALFLSIIIIPLHAQRAPLFKSEVQPVLAKNCVGCHNDSRKMGGLDLSSFAGMMKGSSSGPVIAPGKPERSLLWRLVESGKMPVGGQLSAGDKQLLKTYIEQGRFPAADMAAAEQAREAARITPEARNWWSFRKPVKATPPAVKHAEQVRTAIDAFILSKLEDRGWKLQPDAARVTLLRRAYFDLLGMPPTPAEVQAFLADKSPNAYEKVLDTLLDSPHYGEHWGRHWLDVVGYSDSVGDAGDVDRDVAWKYRDYVIRSFQQNKPYDRMLLEQFAGDQLVNYQPGARPTKEQIDPITATGFLRMTADITDNQTIYEVDKYFDALEKATETSLQVATGLTVGCARCHDHKFDPILQKDYYKLTAVMQAVFDPENWLASNIKYGPWPSRMVLDMEPGPREQWIKAVTSKDARAVRRAQFELEAMYQRYRAEVKAGKELTPELRASVVKEIEGSPDLDPDFNTPRDFITDGELEQRIPELVKKKEEILAKRRGTEAKVKPNYIMAAWDVSKTPSPTYVLMRGNYLSPGAAVGPGIPAVLDDPAKPFQFPDPQQHPEWNHTGRRLTLAKWLTSGDNPLTARVFVNRVWQFHFGEGIVRSVDDFGVQGARPSHPELLDWLAVSFVEHGWDIRWLHKQIMLSSVYRQDHRELAEPMAQDPSNKLLWRKAPVRLEAETIRDSMLKVSGLLEPAMFGPQEPLKRAADGQWIEDDKKGHANRRSIYLAYTRTRPHGFMHAFDAPDMTADHQSQRFRSALPSQSLALLNNPLTLRVTRAFANQVLEQSHGNFEDAVTRAAQAAWSRPPTASEIALAKEAIADDADPKEGLRLFLQAMLAANDFLYSY